MGDSQKKRGGQIGHPNYYSREYMGDKFDEIEKKRIKKIGVVAKRLWEDPAYRVKVEPTMKRNQKSEERISAVRISCVKVGQSNKGKKPWNTGMKMSEEFVQKCKEFNKNPSQARIDGRLKAKDKRNPVWIKNISDQAKARWADPVWAKEMAAKTLEGNKRAHPNKPEKQVIQILKSLSSSIKYVGDGRRWISGMNPDFIDESNKQIIEVLGCYWHGCSKHSPDLKKQRRNTSRINKFKRLGYIVLTIWECELKHSQKVMMKIQKFNGTT